MTDAYSANSSACASPNSAEPADSDDAKRKQIRSIMSDGKLSSVEKSRAVQNIMSAGRRSSIASQTASVASASSSQAGLYSYVSNMAQVARQAAEYYSGSDDEGDAMSDADGSSYAPDEHPDDIMFGNNDYRSVASSVTNVSGDPFHQSGLRERDPRRTQSLQDWNEHSRARAAAQASTLFGDHPAQVSRLMEQSRPQCEHYDRNCTLVSPCCGLAFGCRICHDECPVLPPLLQVSNRKIPTVGGPAGAPQPPPGRMERRRSMPLDWGSEEEEETHHVFDRFAVREIICRQCYIRQSSKADNCIGCGIQFGEYHCNICNLWMSKSESPYHCRDCGFCRVGGRENFTHCDDCGMCIDSQLFGDHNCKAGKYMSDCPVCQEDLFSSRYASHEMPCGHAIHWHCFKELTSYDTRCPVCKRTAESPEEMAATWNAIAMGIALQPVPPEMTRAVDIVCNDCGKHHANRRWHFLGVRCGACTSFNTVVEQTVLHGVEAAAFLDQQDENLEIPTDISMPGHGELPPPQEENDDVSMNDSDGDNTNDYIANDLSNQFREFG